MNSSSSSRRKSSAIEVPDRAVIDIGSNTVRLVVYSGPARAPNVWLNEKVTARLGQDLATTGEIPQHAIDLAMTGLTRFRSILHDLDIRDVAAVATAAPRDASNGPAFLQQVRDLGVDVRLLSGEEEAVTSAFGVIGAFPGARGVVADLGGGSLELVSVEDEDCHDGVSLPLGTLRLPSLRAMGAEKFRKTVRKHLKAAGWARENPGPMYMVGGTWRALASYAMHRDKYPLTDPQAFCLSSEEALSFARKLSKADPEKLMSISGISSSRAAGLPDAAAMLKVMLKELQPDGLVFSAWGIREGLLFRRLDPAQRAQDPLLSGVAHFAGPRGASITDATLKCAWTAEAVDERNRGSERIRLAATMLTTAASRIEPNMRMKHSVDWALEKRWLGLDHTGRAMIAQCLRAACKKPEPAADLLRLASEEQLYRASAWGLANRLCRRIGAGTRVSLMSSALKRDEERLTLRLDADRSHLASDLVESELATLAGWLGLESAIEIVERAEA